MIYGIFLIVYSALYIYNIYLFIEKTFNMKYSDD